MAPLGTGQTSNFTWDNLNCNLSRSKRVNLDGWPIYRSILSATHFSVNVIRKTPKICSLYFAVTGAKISNTVKSVEVRLYRGSNVLFWLWEQRRARVRDQEVWVSFRSIGNFCSVRQVCYNFWYLLCQLGKKNHGHISKTRNSKHGTVICQFSIHR